MYYKTSWGQTLICHLNTVCFIDGSPPQSAESVPVKASFAYSSSWRTVCNRRRLCVHVCSELCLMNAQMVLSLNSQEAGVYRNSEVECASLCHVARLLADEVRHTVWVKKIPPCGFLTFFPNGWEFFNQFLHTYYTFLSTPDYKFLFNYLQLWWHYDILSATTQRSFTFH